MDTFLEPIPINHHEEDDDTTNNTQSSQTTLGKRKPKRRSEVWNHFVKTSNGLAICNYCQEDFACHGKKNGTRTLNSHIGRCKKFMGRQEKEDPKQTVLIHKNESDDRVNNLTIANFTKEKCRRACVEYIVGAELPFKYIENCFLNNFASPFNLDLLLFLEL